MKLITKLDSHTTTGVNISGNIDVTDVIKQAFEAGMMAAGEYKDITPNKLDIDIDCDEYLKSLGAEK